jgi:hypothetical protein
LSKKKTVLICISALVEVPSEIVDDPDFNDLDRLENRLTEAVEKVDSDFKLSWESTERLVLDPITMNCGKCASCGCWASDREKDGVISQLQIAATVDGRLLCDECLPKDHRWAF